MKQRSHFPSSCIIYKMPGTERHKAFDSLASNREILREMQAPLSGRGFVNYFDSVDSPEVFCFVLCGNDKNYE